MVDHLHFNINWAVFDNLVNISRKFVMNSQDTKVDNFAYFCQVLANFDTFALDKLTIVFKNLDLQKYFDE